MVRPEHLKIGKLYEAKHGRPYPELRYLGEQAGQYRFCPGSFQECAPQQEVMLNDAEVGKVIVRQIFDPADLQKYHVYKSRLKGDFRNVIYYGTHNQMHIFGPGKGGGPTRIELTDVGIKENIIDEVDDSYYH